MEEEPTWFEKVFLFGVVATIVLLMWLVVHLTGSRARDLDGEYAKKNPVLHAWFESLRSEEGVCCAEADGIEVADGDWGTDNGSYWVMVPGNLSAPLSSEHQRILVPDDALVKVPNIVGKAMVWPMYQDGHIVVARCFMPGTMG